MSLSHSSGALLIDFGSTFTKVRAVDLDGRKVLAAGQAPSTVETNVMEGLHQALDSVASELPEGFLEDAVRLASSSAGGGLRIVAIGLVESLTTEAAKRAALGAGAKVVATFADSLSRSEVAELEELRPDIVILSGGTDGGDRRCMTENAALLAGSSISCPIIVAGNRKAADDVGDALKLGGKRFTIVDNVLPEIDRLDIDACSKEIRDTFMRYIVESKGLADAESYVGRIVMPTPQAVLMACRLIAEGPGADSGIGSLCAVDVGGATTDVYSISEPGATGGAVLRGLPEPVAKRTVEGDLGLRINAPSVVEAVGADLLAAGDIEPIEFAARLSAAPQTLPESSDQRHFDLAMSAAAARVAMRRHAGTLEVGYGPEGRFFVQRGKDLREIDLLIGTGGIFRAAGREAFATLAACRYDDKEPDHLLPRAPRLVLDRDYMMFAVGLLSENWPEVAYELAVTNLEGSDSDDELVVASAPG